MAPRRTVPPNGPGRAAARLASVYACVLLALGWFAASRPQGQTPTGLETHITFDELGAGIVLSQCLGGGTLPTCTGGTVQNVYEGLTFYSGSGINSGQLTGRVLTFKAPPPPAWAPTTATSTTAVCPESANASMPQNVDCRGRVYVKFAPGVTKFAFGLVGGYGNSPAPPFGLVDDYNAVVTYGPAGFQIQQNAARMYFVWNRFVDFRQFNLTNITGFEVSSTNSHQATYGLAGMGGPALDELIFQNGGCGANALDSDQDGLCDAWETSGVDIDNDGIIDLNLPTLGARPDHKDMFVELDYMAGDANHDHVPDAAAVDAVRLAFANAPLNNPDGTMGIALHLEVDSSESFNGRPGIEERTVLNFPVPGSAPPNVGDFFDLKFGTPTLFDCDGHFGTVSQRTGAGCQAVLQAKRWVYRYGIYGHDLQVGVGPIGSSGLGEIFGDDFVVTLGGGKRLLTHSYGKAAAAAAKTYNTAFDQEWADVEAGTLMHEIGHTLGLGHGGGSAVNCKPNYVSVMNYSRQVNMAETRGPLQAPLRTNRLLEFSSATLPTLDESALNEFDGILGATPGTRVLFAQGMTGFATIGLAPGPIDWSGGGVSGTWPADINDITIVGCYDLFAYPRPATPAQERHGGFNDWAAVKLDFRASAKWSPGFALIPETTGELSGEQILDGMMGATDADADGVTNVNDNCPVDPNPGQQDANGNGIGDVCEPPPPNTAPVVNAGPDQSVALPAAASLGGSATDDGLPQGSVVTVAWTKQSGPGSVVFGNAAAVATSATFGAPGVYVLRLTASDGVLQAFDELTVTATAAPLAELVTNGDFSNGTTGWLQFATPDLTYIVSSVSNGVFQFYRRPPPPGTSNQAVAFQQTGAPLVAGAPLAVSFQIGNSSSVRKRVSVLLHDASFADLSVCTFWLAANTPLTTYGIETHTTQAWSNATVSFYAASANGAGDTGSYLLDNVSVQYAPGNSGVQTRCLDPTAPAPPGGSASASLLVNGDFGSGSTSPGWSTFGQIQSQVSGNVFEFIKLAGAPAGVVLQPTGQALPASDLLTLTLSLGNSSVVRKRVTVLVHESDFSDLAACTFWLAPAQPLSAYAVKTFTTKAWTNATVSIYPATVGADQWIRLDDVALQQTPAATITGTECFEPGSTPDAGVGVVNPVVARDHDAWRLDGFSVVDHGATTDDGVTWGSVAGRFDAAVLAVAEPLARLPPGARLSVRSWYTGTPARARVEVSLDGRVWETIGIVPPSDTWVPMEFDLDAYSGHELWLRFVLEPEPERAVPDGVWQIGGIEVH